MFNKIKQGLKRSEKRGLDRKHEKFVQGNEKEAYDIVNGTIERLADLGYVLMPVIKRKQGSRSHVYSDIELVPATRQAFEAHLDEKENAALRKRQVALRDDHAANPQHVEPECVECHPDQAVPAEHCAGEKCVDAKSIEEICECPCVDCVDAKRAEGEKAIQEEFERTCTRCDKRIENGELASPDGEGRRAHKSCLPSDQRGGEEPAVSDDDEDDDIEVTDDAGN